MENRVSEIAKRIYDLVDPWDREWATESEIMDEIRERPLEVIEYLIDMLDES